MLLTAVTRLLSRTGGFLILLIFAVIVRSFIVRVGLLQLAVEGCRFAGVMFFLFGSYGMPITEYDNGLTVSLLLTMV